MLFRAGSNTNSSKELPNVNILTGVNSTREDMGKCRFESIKEIVVCVDPEYVSMNLKIKVVYLPICPLLIVEITSLSDKFGST